MNIEKKIIIKKLGKLAAVDIVAINKSYGGFYEKS